MVISFDFDKTFTLDPIFFREAVYRLRQRGHTPIMTTQRCVKFEAEIRRVVLIEDLPIVFASGRSKEDAAKAAGYDVDVWVDDSPFSVHTALTYRGC
jgi:hypothetical protein